MEKVFSVLLLCLLPIVAYPQKTVEVNLSVGVTGVDLDKLVEKDEVPGTTVSDWDVTNIGINVQYLFRMKGDVGFGAEIMYQHLYWYSVRMPFGSQVIHREYYVNGMKIASFARFNPMNKVSFDIGPELGFFDGVNPGIFTSANLDVPVSDNISIPLKLRVEVIHNIVVTVPVSLNAGVRIDL